MKLKRVIVALVVVPFALALVVELALLIYIGATGSRTVVYGDGVPHPCAPPPWPYEAINYAIALDAEPTTSMPCDARKGTAGNDVVATDGVRIAGWYIPAANGAPPTAPTVV